MQSFAFFNEPIVTIYSEPSPALTDAPQKSAISDETCYGQICRILEEGDIYDKVVMDIGYTGYVRKEFLLRYDEDTAKAALRKERYTIVGRCVDVMNIPAVTGIRLLSLYAGAVLEVLPFPETEEPVNGWSPVALLDGRRGYVPTKYLERIFYDETTVFRFDGSGSFDDAVAEVSDESARFLVTKCLAKHWNNDEAAFREGLCQVARQYLGVQYRWGGRSGAGIDCSGLVSTAYRRCGLHIYRDAKLVEGWPMRQISMDEAKPGDALYFPGHIALYLGDGLYIHSTAKAGSNGVVINSLCPEADNYREDLVQSMYAVGTVF